MAAQSFLDESYVMAAYQIMSCSSGVYVRKLPQSVSDEGRYRAARVAKKIKYLDKIKLFCTVVQASVYQDIICLSQPSNIHCMRCKR